MREHFFLLFSNEESFSRSTQTCRSVCFIHFGLARVSVPNEWSKIEQKVCCAVLAELHHWWLHDSRSHDFEAEFMCGNWAHARLPCEYNTIAALLWFLHWNKCHIRAKRMNASANIKHADYIVSGHGKWHILRASKQYSGHFEIHHTLAQLLSAKSHFDSEKIVYSFVEAYTRHVHRTHTVKRLIYFQRRTKSKRTEHSTRIARSYGRNGVWNWCCN